MSETKEGFGDKLRRWAKPKNILLFLTLFIFMVIIYMFGNSVLKEISGGYGSIDMEFGYTPEKIFLIISSYGSTGKSFYFYLFLLDLMFILNYWILFLLLINYFWRNWNHYWVGFLCIFPFVTMVADYLENITVLLTLNSYPLEVATYYARVMGMVSMAKFILFGVCALIIVIGIPIFIVGKINKSKENNE